MANNNLKCQDTASGLPGGLTIESSIDPLSGRCFVGGDGGTSHVVSVRNRTLLRFEVSISAECETPNIRYANDSDHWDDNISVGCGSRRGT